MQSDKQDYINSFYKKNDYLSNRIESIFTNLENGYSAGLKFSSASKGAERELFVSSFLKQVFPNHFRFSSGDITDSNNQISGQVDVVLEYAHGFSFPLIDSGPRMFLAENVAIAIEVKSNLSSQWQEVCETARKIKQLNRKFSSDNLQHLLNGIQSGYIETGNQKEEQIAKISQAIRATQNKGVRKIPVYAVGFEGWKNLDTLKQKVQDSDVDGIFVINEKLFASSDSSGGDLASMLLFLQDIENIFAKEVAPFPVSLFYMI